MKTRAMMVGAVPLGGGARVSVQSMTNTDTRGCGGYAFADSRPGARGLRYRARIRI